MSFFEELKRRNVFRVGIAYGVTAWLLIQISDTVFPRIGLSESAVTLVIALLGMGFVPALIFPWAFEMTPECIKRERDAERAESITPQTRRKPGGVIIARLAAVVGWRGGLYMRMSNDLPVAARTRLPRKRIPLPGARIRVPTHVSCASSPEFWVPMPTPGGIQ